MDFKVWTINSDSIQLRGDDSCPFRGCYSWLVGNKMYNCLVTWGPFQRACCANRWVVEEWSPCSKTCGKLGYQSRLVQCMQALHNGTNRPVHSKHCTEDRPESRRACNHTVCPAQWRTGAWSQVSASTSSEVYLTSLQIMQGNQQLTSVL